MENKPCPFCGSKVGIHKYDDGTVRAVCLNINCPVESFKFRTKGEALEWWNKRAEEE